MSCYGNPRYWFSQECYYLKCLSIASCEIERRKNKKKQDLNIE